MNSPTIKLSQSDNIIREIRDTKKSIVDFVCALKRKKNNNFQDIYFSILEATQLPPKFVRTEELGSLSKIENIRLKRLFSRGRAAYGSIQNLSKASGLSKKKVEQFLQTKTSYTQFVPQSRCFRKPQAFSK